MNHSKEKFDVVVEKAKQLTAADLAKTVATMTVHHCVAAVVVTIAHNLMPTTTKTQKVKLYIAARVVSGMVADKASDRIGQKFDTIEAFVREVNNKTKADETSTDEPTEAVQEEPTEQ